MVYGTKPRQQAVLYGSRSGSKQNVNKLRPTNQCLRKIQNLGSIRPVTCQAAGSVNIPFHTDGGEVTGGEFTRGNRILAVARATLFYIFTFIVAFPLFLIMLAIFPFVLLFDKLRRSAEHAVNTVWATLSTWPFYRVVIDGQENLPSQHQPAIYIANHESYLDIFTLFHLHRDFKFVSKVSNFLIPIVGWSMFLTGHVMLKRTDKRSQIKVMKECLGLLQKGVSILFYPEGTRTKNGKLQDFKKGAFSLAVKANVPVVPITLIGTGALMPNANENQLFLGDVKVVVHPPLYPAGETADSLCVQAKEQISSVLPSWKLLP